MNVLILAECFTNPHCGGWGRYTNDLQKELRSLGASVCMVTGANEKDNYALRLLPTSTKFKRIVLGGVFYAFYIFMKVKGMRIDVVHTTVEPYAWIGFVLSRLLNAKHVITVHGSRGVLMLQNPFYAWFQKKAYLSAHKIVCVSAFTERKLKGYLSLKNTTVIHNGIDVKRFLQTSQKKDVSKNVLIVGAVKPRKGHHIVFEAFVKVHRSHPDVFIHVVGDMSDTAYVKKLKDFAIINGIQGNIIWHNIISDERLASLYSDAFVFTLPSLVSDEYFEGFGLVYLEANMYGVPTIGSRGTAAEESISENVSGLLIDQNDSDALASAIKSLISNPVQYKKLSTSARTWAESFTWVRVGRQYYTLYVDVIDRH